MFKSLLASTVIAIAILTSGSLYAADDQCQTPEMVTQRNKAEAASHGIQVEVATLQGEEGAKVRQFIMERFKDSKVIAFDAATFVYSATQENVLMVLYDNGCAVSGGPITQEEFRDLIKGTTSGI